MGRTQAVFSGLPWASWPSTTSHVARLRNAMSRNREMPRRRPEGGHLRGMGGGGLPPMRAKAPVPIRTRDGQEFARREVQGTGLNGTSSPRSPARGLLGPATDVAVGIFGSDMLHPPCVVEGTLDCHVVNSSPPVQCGHERRPWQIQRDNGVQNPRTANPSLHRPVPFLSGFACLCDSAGSSRPQYP